jgi:hypothetical protein
MHRLVDALLLPVRILNPVRRLEDAGAEEDCRVCDTHRNMAFSTMIMPLRSRQSRRRCGFVTDVYASITAAQRYSAAADVRCRFQSQVRLRDLFRDAIRTLRRRVSRMALLAIIDGQTTWTRLATLLLCASEAPRVFRE